MGTRTIQLDEDVYERIESAQHEDETVSETINRLLGSTSLHELVGTLSDDAAAEARETITTSRDADIDAERELYEDSP
jgi:predicted CopG family antitoxin